MNRTTIAGTAKFTRAVASVSWIDRRLWPRLLEVDRNAQADFVEPAAIPRDRIVARSGYRFVNLLEVEVELDRAGRIRSGHILPTSGSYRGPSFFGVESETYEVCVSRVITPGEARFVQLVGCRTRSPERIAEVVGFRLGREVVEQFYVFPPIWTELTLTVRPDGSSQGRMTRRSEFPSVTVFERSGIDCDARMFRRVSNDDARAALESWDRRGWGALDKEGGGNPWNIPRPVGWGDRRDASHGRCPKALPLPGSPVSGTHPPR